MSGSERFRELVETVDFAIAEQRHLRARGVHLVVTHRDHVPGTSCAPGEIVGDIELGGLPEPASFGLSHMSLLLMDCLCRYRIPLSARRIEEIMRTDSFYVHYAENRNGRRKIIAKPDRRMVRVLVRRILARMTRVLQDARVGLLPHDILTAETAEDNQALYRLKATIEITHIDKPKSVATAKKEAVRPTDDLNGVSIR